ncbi:MAG TPA: response regulator [Bacteroidales bacterium]|nr:response regulator [Bacteroidales bacterium]
MDNQKLIFIVDDDQFINTLITKRFTAEGYKVEAFTYGEECIKALSKNPDAIILDYYFISNDQKVMNGMEVLDKIKELKPETPVIMLSGQEKGEIVLELARKGIDDYIIKDNNLIENLKSALNELFE